MKKVSELVNNKNYDLLKEFNQEKKNEDFNRIIKSITPYKTKSFLIYIEK